MQPQTRKQMIQKIHIGKGMLKMTDEQYKRFLLDTVDKHSCTVMTDAELMQVLRAIKAKGAVFSAKNAAKTSRHQGRIKRNIWQKSPHF